MRKKQKNGKKKIAIILVIIIIVCFVIIKNKANQTVQETKLESELIEKRDIAKSISATGIITSADSQDVISTLSGNEIATVNVTEGQTINIGDVICTFDMSSIQKDLSNAKSSANIATAQSDLSVQSAQRSLTDAMKSRDNDIINAQKEVASTQSAYDNMQNQINTLTATIQAKQAELSTLTNDGETTQAEMLSTEISGLQASLIELQTQLPTLKSAYETALATLTTVTNAGDSTVSSMRENLANAELSAESNNITQDSQLKTYKEQLEKGIVTSTIDGVVTSVGVKVGDIYSGGNIVTINGNDNFIIESEVDEYDIADIQVGMKVLIKTDSTRNEELEGKVTYVAPAATKNTSITGTTSTSTSATYKVKISLDTPNDRLRLGMNAKLSIITESKEGVWAVPYNAVQDSEDGSKYIEIMKNEETQETEEIAVTTGIEGAYYIEILSNELKDGMNVVLPNAEENDSVETLINLMGADAGV